MTSRDRFAGKVAFVTGAGNGIGQATAIAFAREGASVVAAPASERTLGDARAGTLAAMPSRARTVDRTRGFDAVGSTP